MSPRPPAPSLLRPLRRLHVRVRRALVLRQALRASTAALVLLACAVTLGLALPRTPGTAWARLVLFGCGALAGLALAARAAWRDTPRWEPWLESLESRFDGLRSWLRNALDLENKPDAHTSGELAEALREETARRLDTLPLAGTVPSVQPRTPLIAAGTATLSLAALFFIAPGPALDSWHTLFAPATAAPPVELVVEPGNVTLVPGASFAVRARVGGTVRPPQLLGSGAAPLAVLEASADGARRWRFDLP